MDSFKPEHGLMHFQAIMYRDFQKPLVTTDTLKCKTIIFNSVAFGDMTVIMADDPNPITPELWFSSTQVYFIFHFYGVHGRPLVNKEIRPMTKSSGWALEG